MKKMAFVVLLAIGVTGVANAYAQDKTVKKTETKTISARANGALSGKKLTKTPVQKTGIATAKSRSVVR